MAHASAILEHRETALDSLNSAELTQLPPLWSSTQHQHLWRTELTVGIVAHPRPTESREPRTLTPWAPPQKLVLASLQAASVAAGVAPAGVGLCPVEVPVGAQHRTQKKRNSASRVGNVGPRPGSHPRSKLASTYRSSEAAPQSLELLRTQILLQAAARGRGRLHAPAVGRGLGADGDGRGSPRPTRPLISRGGPRRRRSRVTTTRPPPARTPPRAALPAPPDDSAPRPHRPLDTRGRRGGGFARDPTQLRSPT